MFCFTKHDYESQYTSSPHNGSSFSMNERESPSEATKPPDHPLQAQTLFPYVPPMNNPTTLKQIGEFSLTWGESLRWDDIKQRLSRPASA